MSAPGADPGDGKPSPPVRPRPSDAAMSGRVASAVLVFLAVFVGVFLWIAA